MWGAIVGDAMTSIIPRSADDLRFRPDLLARLGLEARYDNESDKTSFYEAGTDNRVNDTSALDAALSGGWQQDARGNLVYGTNGPGSFTAGVPTGLQGFDLNGGKYSQTGYGYDDLAANPKYADFIKQSGVTPQDFSYDPTYGYVQAVNDRTGALNTQLGQYITQQNEGGLADRITGMGPIILGTIGTGGALGGAFAGMDAAGTMIPAGQTGLLNMLSAQGGLDLGASDIGAGGTIAGGEGSGGTLIGQTAGDTFGAEGGTSLSTLLNPENLLESMNFSAPVAGSIAQVTPGLSLDALSTAGGLSLAPGAGLVGSGAGGALTLADVLKFAGSPLGRTALSAGGNIASALIGSNAAKSAADTQVKSAGDANALIASMFNQNRADLEPWRTAGALSLGDLTRRLGLAGDPNSPGYGALTKPFSTADLNADPIYGAQRDFLAKTGQDRILNAASARGETDSGTTLKALMDYANGVVSTTGNDAFNRNNASKTFIANLLAGVSGTGQTSATQVAGLGANAANQQANNVTSAGAVQAAGQVGSANAITGAINSTLQSYQAAQQQAAQQPFIDAATMALLKRFLPNTASAE